MDRVLPPAESELGSCIDIDIDIACFGDISIAKSEESRMATRKLARVSRQTMPGGLFARKTRSGEGIGDLHCQVD